jgi:UbiD family decarboxylase
MYRSANTYYSDFRALIDDFERRGKLYRWRERVNKDTELMPLMRLQYRGLPDDRRQVLLFENICDGHGEQFDVKVATGMYGSSRQILGLGMGCEDPGDIYEKWHRALGKPLQPRIIDFSPLHEEV